MKYLSLTPMYLLCFTLLPHVVFSASDLSHICFVSDPGHPIHPPRNDPVHPPRNDPGIHPPRKNPADDLSNKTLDVLFTNLSSEASPTGFATKSIGQNKDAVNGLALCRGDVDSNDCKTCLTEASSKIVQRCPSNKGGIIWYTDCLLKYSNVNFFGTIDYHQRFYYSLKYVRVKVNLFNEKTKEFLSQLTTEIDTKPMLFATGEVELWETVKLYGLVQCTRDISGAQCKKCLVGIISKFNNCCAAKEGGRILGGSCNFRYEIYPFVKA